MPPIQAPSRYKLSIFSLTMLTVVSVDSLRNLPATALFGSQLVFFFLLAAVVFLIPTALISAELSSIVSEDGESGIYIWVKQAFNQKIGLLAIWLQWIENIIWYPTVLAFVAGSLAYLINPALIHNKLFLTATILIAFWFTTLINVFGMQSSAWFSNFCSIAGMMLPMLLIIGLGTLWLIKGNPSHIVLNHHTMLPNLTHLKTWAALTAIVLSFTGMEIATVHARHTQNPQRSFPIALAYASVIILSTLLLGGLAIAMIVPLQHINLIAGIMQTFDLFLQTYHLHPLLPIIALMLVIGGMGNVSNWSVAPITGLAIAAKDGALPTWVHKKNRYNAPARALIVQALLVSLLSTLFLIIPKINESYWLLTALAVQLYMLMYILMFAAALKMRHQLIKNKQPTIFRMPGGLPVLWLVCGLGLLGSLLTLCIAFVPPLKLYPHEQHLYWLFLCIAFPLLAFAPLSFRRQPK